MSNNRNTVIRALHDVGGAAWFGGALMGAVALNGASQHVADPKERTGVAAAGWARWTPVSALAIGAHLVGGLGLVIAHRGRVANQRGVGANTVAKTILTGLAVATTAYSGVLGAKIAAAGPVEAAGATVPSERTPADVATVQQQQRLLQWVTPALTGLIVILGSQQGEQQRPAEVALGLVRKIGHRR